MRALTIRQPWAALIACGAKSVEYRRRPTSYRGRLAVHVSQREADPQAVAFARHVAHSTLLTDATLEASHGMIIATVDLLDCRACMYDAPIFAWMLADVRVLDRPIAARGSLGLWAPSPIVLAMIVSQ